MSCLSEKDIKLSLWYPIQKERIPIIKQKIAEIINGLLADDFSNDELSELVMNLRQNVRKNTG